MKDKVLIYGAGGYMGKLFTRYAKENQLPFILGNRSPFVTNEPVRIFAIEDEADIAAQLYDVKLVVNLAGPFALTQRLLILACIATNTHYIDISGEVPEFASAFQFNEIAHKSGVMLMPGAGFGVVPTDVAAKLARNKLPDATHLTLAYVTVGGVSRGTLYTVLKHIEKDGIEVVNLKAITASPAQSDFHFMALNKRYRVVYNPWRGDLFTATHSTFIPNIKTYANFPVLVEQMMKGRWLWLRNFLLRWVIRFLPEGPSEKLLRNGKTFIHAEVKNGKGQKAVISIQGPEAYLFTAQTLVNITIKVMQNEIKPGFQVPSIYGKEILTDNFRNVVIT